MSQKIYWQNLDPEIANAIKDAMKSGITFVQETIPATTVGQNVWKLPWTEFVVGQDLLFVVNNTATLHDDMYTITKQGAESIVTLKAGYIPADLPIADNTLFVTMAKGVKFEGGVVVPLLAKNVTFEPVDGLTKTNVQEAIEEVFVYAKEIVKTVADSLGTPFLATDSRVEMDEKLKEMMARFRRNLINKKVTPETTDTLYQLIDLILEIDTPVAQTTPFEYVEAPFDWVLTLQHARKNEDLLLTVIEQIPALDTNEIYSCLFESSDSTKFETNANLEFSNSNVHILNHHNYDFTLDTTWAGTGSRHKLEMKQATIGDINDMHVTETYNDKAIWWIQPAMVGVDLPSPFRSRSSTNDGVNFSWKAFSDDEQFWSTARRTTGNAPQEWLRFDMGETFPLKSIAFEGDKAVQKIEIWTSDDESAFTGSAITTGWTLRTTVTPSTLQFTRFLYMNLPSIVNARYTMILFTRYTSGTNKEKPITVSTVAFGKEF